MKPDIETRLTNLSTESEDRLSHDALMLSIVALKSAMLTHPSASIRIHALFLLIRSKSPKEPFSSESLNSMQNHFPYFHTEVDTKTRNEFVALVKKFLSRFNAVLVAQNQSSAVSKYRPEANGTDRPGILKQNLSQEPGQHRDAKTSCTEHHLVFIRWYMSFLADELQPTASYQRHITALEILHCVFEHSVDHYNSPPLNPIILDQCMGRSRASYAHRLTRNLFDLVVDPFSDVRILAASILLRTRQIELPGTPATSITFSAMVERAEQLTRATGRADHAEGLAGLQLLTWQLTAGHEEWCDEKTTLLETMTASLKNDLEQARLDLRFAVANAPLHGNLVALR